MGQRAIQIVADVFRSHFWVTGMLVWIPEDRHDSTLTQAVRHYAASAMQMAALSIHPSAHLDIEQGTLWVNGVDSSVTRGEIYGEYMAAMKPAVDAVIDIYRYRHV